MSLEYAPSPITEIQGNGLAVAFVQVGVNRRGEPSAPRWWNHDKGGFDPAFVAVDHLRALDRADADPTAVNHAFQSFGVPMDVIDDNMDVQAFLYRADDSGAWQPFKVYSRSHLGYFSGA